MDDKNSVVSAVAIRDGCTAEIGRHLQALGRCARATLNLRIATVNPGFITA
jgi:predicted amidohydrolase YtcJ